MPPSKMCFKIKFPTLRFMDFYNKSSTIFITTYTHRHQGNCRMGVVVMVVVVMVVVVGEEEEVFLKYNYYVCYTKIVTLRSYIGQKGTK